MTNELHSIVVPVYQSKGTLEILVQRVEQALKPERLRFEIILVDDGSQDGSFEEIQRLSKIHPFVRGFRLSRNFGHQPALVIGLSKAQGEYIAIMDDDLQDPPEVLPSFFKALYHGADVAYGIRKARKESLLKRFLYAGFYRVLDLVSDTKIPIDAGDFCAIRRRVLNAMLQLRSARPFLRGLRSWVGFKQVGVEYERAARFQGESGYTLKKYIQFAVTGILSFSYIPLRAITYVGLLTALICVIYLLLVVVGKLLGFFNVPGYASLVSVLVLFGAVQLISIGIIGEYLARLFDEAKNWPVAFIAAETGEGNR